MLCERHQFRIEFAMADDRIARRNKLRETRAELRNTALAELKHRGYELRGKSPGEIRQLLKRRPLKKNRKLRSAKKVGDPNAVRARNIF